MIIEGSILSDIESKSYTIKFAKSQDEIDVALRLRYQVFKEELDRNFSFQSNKDKDKFDEQSHHLLVVENESGNIVATYRLQTYEQALSGNGFVCNQRFHLEQFPRGVLENGVEVGRACIRKDHRKGRVLYLLWKGFAGYLTHFEKRYLFGYAAMDTKDPAIVWNTCQYLQENGFFHPEYKIDVREEYRLDDSSLKSEINEVDIPPLLQNYLDVGTYICSDPSFDQTINLYHFMILLDIEKISDRIKKLFFG